MKALLIKAPAGARHIPCSPFLCSVIEGYVIYMAFPTSRSQRDSPNPRGVKMLASQKVLVSTQEAVNS